MLALTAPLLFVLIWSTGFIVSRAVVPFVAPELFLAVRMVVTTSLLCAAALAAREPWPRGRRLRLHLTAGVLMHGVYLCISWWAVARGVPAGIMALFGSLQPLVIAVASTIVWRERLGGRGWAGLAIAIAGVACVLAPSLARSGAAALDAAGAIAAGIAVLGMAAGTMIQRGALANDPIRVTGAIQNGGGALFAIVATGLVGQYRWENVPVVWGALAWSVLMLSMAGLSLLIWMVRHQGPARVSALLLAVPVLTAIEAHLLFGDRLGWLQIAGFALALGGVLLARAGTKVPPAEPA